MSPSAMLGRVRRLGTRLSGGKAGKAGNAWAGTQAHKKAKAQCLWVQGTRQAKVKEGSLGGQNAKKQKATKQPGRNELPPSAAHM